MVKIIYVEYDGIEKHVDVPKGTNLMQGAVRNEVNGIDGDCGGACACATCHVYVAEEWLGKIEPRSSEEEDMLDFATDVKSNSRLACQIKASEKIDGMRLQLPKSQF